MQVAYRPIPAPTGRAHYSSPLVYALAASCLLLVICASAPGADRGTNGVGGKAAHRAISTPGVRPSEACGESAPGEITVEKIEVIQVIQDIESMVPLVAGKATLVRAYLRYDGESAVTVRGELSLARHVEKRDAAGNLVRDQAGNILRETVESVLPSANELTVDPADTTPLGANRASLGRSLNFVLEPGRLSRARPSSR